jgi:aspartate-semialdehyde dehydrogenase
MARRVGIIGFRGMVGSVLLERMRAEKDFEHFEPEFFSTSQAGQPAPDVGQGPAKVADANDIDALRSCDALVSCQGGDYTKAVHPKLRQSGYKGYWIDAASTLRMDSNAVIVLDPVNRRVIDEALARGVRDCIGGNCTVSLMLLAIQGLFEKGWVEWVSSMTYQAASGAGAKNMRELLLQMRGLTQGLGRTLDDPNTSILELDRAVSALLASGELPTAAFGAPLAASLIPWIDSAVADGQTREEWKGHVEANKILGLNPEVPVDGLCVRVGAMRSHSLAMTIKLKRDVPLPEIEQALGSANSWVDLVPNNKEATLRGLSPAAVSGTLRIAVGRIHKLRFGPEYLGCFAVGDQLLWGAAEPLRRVLRIALDR